MNDIIIAANVAHHDLYDPFMAEMSRDDRILSTLPAANLCK